MNIFSISSFVAFVTCELIAGFVYLKNPRSNINKSFTLLAFLIGIWTLFPFVNAIASTNEKAILLTRLVYIAAIFVPPIFLHFVFNLLRISSFKKEKIELIIFYLISCVFLVLSFSPLFIKGVVRFLPHFAVQPGKIYFTFFIFFVLMAVLGHHKFFISYKRAKGYRKNQLIYLLISFFIASIAGLMHFLSAYGIKEIFPHDFLVILFTAVITYAIVRYRLMDIRLVFKKSLAYSLSAGLLTGLFIVLVLILTRFLSDFAGVDELKISIISALIIALLFSPLKNRIQTLVDKVFYKITYDYYATIQKVSHELAATIDVKNIYSFIADTVFTTLKPKSAYLLSANVKSYKVVHFRLPKDKPPDESMIQCHKIDEDSELVKFLKNRNDIIIKEELPRIVNQDRADIIAEELKPFKGEVVVPIFIDNKLALLLILGEKLSGDIFSDEDINLLNTIANQAAIAIKNATLYAEKIHSERLASTGMMAATLAHEIKNPLASIKVFTQLIPERYYDKEFRETFSKIVSSEIQRMDKLVTELLDFSRQPPIAISNVTASNLLDDTLELFKGQFEENSIKIIKDYRNNYDIAGDPQRLKQALINIIINSYQAMNYGGVLNVTIAHEGDYVNISVNDNGVGIPEDDLERIFDPFFTTKQRGAGLGLAISKKIVEDHGGKIMVTSRRSEGTTFVLSLPSFKEINSGVIDGAYSASERQR